MAAGSVVAGSERSERSALPDDEVVRRVLLGEAALFEVVMRRYNQRLYRLARAILRDDAEAEDVMQHAYVQAYAHLSQFAGRARFSTWLTRICLYEALARASRRNRDRLGKRPPDSDENTMDTLESQRPDPEQEALQAEARALLEAAIEGLPPAYRSVFTLREVEGLDTAETAECLEVSEDVVKTRLHRAKGLLRRALLRRAGIAAASAFSFHLSRCDRVVARVLAEVVPAPRAVH